MNIITNPFRASLSKLAVAVTTLSVASTAMAAQSINQLSVNQPSTTTTELAIAFTDKPIQPTAYQLTKPNRLVLDFPKVNSQLASRLQSFNQGNIKDVTALSSGDMTRLIVNLKDEASFTTRVDNNRLIINMQSTATSTVPVATTPIVPVIATPPAIVETSTSSVITKPTANDTMVVRVNPLLNPTATVSRQYNYDGLSAINYNPSANGGGNINVVLANASIPVDVQRTGDELVIRMQGATIPNNLLHQTTVGGGLVRDIVTNNQGRNGVIRIAMNSDYEYKAYQTGNQLNISIEQPRKLRQPTLEERTYTGAPLSLEFQDVSVRTILEVLGGHTNTNIVASDSVSGNITLRLINVPWDQALDIILKSKNLDKRVNNNVIWVAPAEELAKQEAAELKAIQDKQELSPLRTEYIRLNYAKADSLRQMIEADRVGGENNRGSTGSLLSSRGTVTIEPRTNMLIVKDTSESIANIRELVSKVDIPVKQVMIEARIVSANDSFSKEMGVKWGILSSGLHSNRDMLVGGSDQTLWDLKKYDIKTQTVGGQSISYPSYTITRPDNLNVNLGATNPAGRIAFGLLNISDMLLDLELSAMQADNKGEVISSPKVLTADKQTAKVMSGTQIPYQEASASGATATSFIEAALSLEVTPNITPEGRIGMDLTIENGTPTIINGSTAVAKDSVKTNVVVDDGQTVVLGGIFKNTINNGVTKVPFLGDLPYVNRLFRRTNKSDTKQELLIFVTPKLINDGTSRVN